MKTPIDAYIERYGTSPIFLAFFGNIVYEQKDEHGDWTILKTKKWPIIFVVFSIIMCMLPILTNLYIQLSFCCKAIKKKNIRKLSMIIFKGLHIYLRHYIQRERNIRTTLKTTFFPAFEISRSFLRAKQVGKKG